MKAEKYYFILAIVTAILCAPALGEAKLPQPAEHALIARPNPALAGIEKLLVGVRPTDTDPNKEVLVWRELEAKIINQLNKAGIKTVGTITGNILEINELRVYIDMLKLEDLQQYVSRIQTSFATKVSLANEPKRYIKADVWKAPPVIQAVSVESMPAAITNVVLEQVEEFIHAWFSANPPGERPSDINEISGVIAPMSVGLADKSSAAKYQYVASKNSKVFHKPQCSSARRISPKNLIGYHSRQEAIRAGKRPCKICKP